MQGSWSCLIFTAVFAWGQAGDLNEWPQWRGPLGTGVAPHADPPIQWSETQNIRWKTTLPGKGHATPIVWGDKVFITMAEPFGERLAPKYSHADGTHHGVPVTHQHRFGVLAVHRDSGKVLWRTDVATAVPHEGGHYTGSLASNSPVTDGRHLIAFFGSNGIFGLDLDGNLLWGSDLGDMMTKHGHGEGASPALHGDTVVVNWDHEGQSFIVALDKATGAERWRVDREEVTSWATPIVVVHDGKPQVVVSGSHRVRGYDLATGRVIWECGGLSRNVVASPVAAGGMVFAGSSYDKQAMLAIRLNGARGDITGSPHIAWALNKGTPYVPSPLLYGDALYFLHHYQGILSRLDTQTGTQKGGPIRLRGVGNVYASPVGAAGRIYITGMNGATLVLDHDERLRVLAQNRLDEAINASAALVGKELFLRGEISLYCIANSKPAGQ